MLQWGRRLLLILLVQGISSPAAAHSRSTSYSVWDFSGETVQLRVRMAEIDLTRLELHPDYSSDYAGKIQAMLARDLLLNRAGQPCTYDDDAQLRRSQGQVIVEMGLDCSDQGDYQIASQLLLGPLPSHLHFAQIIQPDGATLERVLTRDEPQWELASGTAASVQAPASITGFWWLGVEHILSGWDHLAFVLCLLLLASSFTQLAWLITGFTVGHSVTLALAVLAVVTPTAAAVEALIALSILLVAAEVCWQLAGRPRRLPLLFSAALLGIAVLQPAGLPLLALAGMALFIPCYFELLGRVQRPHRLRAVIALSFGLFHGFGFAGVLGEMDLSTANLAQALFGFNIGVETGQLVVVAVFWPLLRWLNRHHAAVPQYLSAAVAGLGTYWFILRALA